MPTASAASDVLAQLCLDLRTLREQAGGPSVRVLSEEVGLGKSQLDAILNGDADARQMLVCRVGQERMWAEPDAVDELIEVCGRLPIALAIVAARAATRPDFPLSAIVEETSGALRGLGAFHTGDSGTDLRALFSWSYEDLGTDAARLFRLLGMHIGARIGADAAASLLGTAVRKVRPLLGELTRAHLVTEMDPGRYGFHDLLRAYALQSVHSVETAAQRHAAQRRILDHYVHTAYSAALLISPHRVPIAVEPMDQGVTPQRLRDRDEAMRWFTAERDVLLATIEQAAMAGYDAHAWQLGWTLADFLEKRGQFHDWIAVQHHAVAAARRLQEPNTLARNLTILGNACLFAGAYDQAQLALHEALDTYQRLGDLTGQGRCEHKLGGLLGGAGPVRRGAGVRPARPGAVPSRRRQGGAGAGAQRDRLVPVLPR